MAFELPGVYHTKSMVNLLKKQGHNHLAMNLAEQILEERPGYEEVQNLCQTMKNEMKSSWARLSQSRNNASHKIVQEEVSTNTKKVVLLQRLLDRIEKNKGNRGSSV